MDEIASSRFFESVAQYENRARNDPASQTDDIDENNDYGDGIITPSP